MDRTPQRFYSALNNSQCPTPNQFLSPSANNHNFMYQQELENNSNNSNSSLNQAHRTPEPLPMVYDASNGQKGRGLSIPTVINPNASESRVHQNQASLRNINSSTSDNNMSNHNHNSGYGGGGADRERLKDMMADSFSRNETISILPGFKEDSSSHNNRSNKPSIKQSNSQTVTLTLGDKPPYAYTNSPNQPQYSTPNQCQGQGHCANQNQGQWTPQSHTQNNSHGYQQEFPSYQFQQQPQNLVTTASASTSTTQLSQQRHGHGGTGTGIGSRTSGPATCSSDPTPWPYGNQKSQRSIRQAQAAYKLELDKQVEEKRLSQTRDKHIRKSLSSNSKSNLQPLQSASTRTKSVNQSVSLEAFRNTGFLPAWFDPIRNNPLLIHNNSSVNSNTNSSIPIPTPNPNQIDGHGQSQTLPLQQEIASFSPAENQIPNQNQYIGQKAKPIVVKQYITCPGAETGSGSIDCQPGQIIYSPRSQTFQSSSCGRYYIVPQEAMAMQQFHPHHLSSSSQNQNVQFSNQPAPSPAPIQITNSSPVPQHTQQQQQQQQSNNFWPPWLNLANLPPPPSPRSSQTSESMSRNQNVQIIPVPVPPPPVPNAFYEKGNGDIQFPVTLSESEESVMQSQSQSNNNNVFVFGQSQNQKPNQKQEFSATATVSQNSQIVENSERKDLNRQGEGGIGPGSSSNQHQQCSQHYQGQGDDDDTQAFFENQIQNLRENGSGDDDNGFRMLQPHVSQTADQRPDEEVMRIHYKSELAKQIEDRKRLEEERAAKQLEEDAKFQRKIEEDQRRMVEEYEEEQRQHKLKQEEYRLRQEMIIKEKERFDREAENLKLKKQQERRQRISSMSETPRRPSSKEKFNRSKQPTSAEEVTKNPNSYATSQLPYESPVDLTICAASKWATEARAKSPSNSKSESEETGSGSGSSVISMSSSSEELPTSVYVPNVNVNVNAGVNVDSVPSSLSGRGSSCGRDLESPRPRTVVISQHGGSSLNFGHNSEGGVGCALAMIPNISDYEGDAGSGCDAPPPTSKSHLSALADHNKNCSMLNREHNNGVTFLANVRKALLAEHNRMDEIIKRRERLFVTF